MSKHVILPLKYPEHTPSAKPVPTTILFAMFTKKTNEKQTALKVFNLSHIQPK